MLSTTNLMAAAAAFSLVQLLAFLGSSFPAFRGLTTLLAAIVFLLLACCLIAFTIRSNGSYSRTHIVPSVIPFAALFMFLLVFIGLGAIASIDPHQKSPTEQPGDLKL